MKDRLNGERVAQMSDTLPINLSSAALGVGRHVSGIATSQDFNGDIALIACFASSWTPAMVWRWHADPFGFCAHGTRCRRSWGARHPLRPLVWHRRGHFPDGIASNGPLSQQAGA
jgi:hypothetical protein